MQEEAERCLAEYEAKAAKQQLVVEAHELLRRLGNQRNIVPKSEKWLARHEPRIRAEAGMVAPSFVGQVS